MKSLRCHKPHIVFQECPGEVALCFSMFGCPLRCEGCHSEELWNDQGGDELTPQVFKRYLNQYKGLITAVVFFGGEWQPKNLQLLLALAQQLQLKTCLYTGLNAVSRHLRPYLNFVKVGPWTPKHGGLDNPNSNQKFYALEQGKISKDLSALFRRENPALPVKINAPVQIFSAPINEPALSQLIQQIPLLKMEIALIKQPKYHNETFRVTHKRVSLNNATPDATHQYSMNLVIHPNQENNHAAA